MAEALQTQTVGNWLRSYPNLDRFDLELGLIKTLDCSRASILSHPERQLTTEEWSQLQQWSHDLSRHVPVAYLCDEQEFWGLTLQVDERVLVPRPDTETLVERALHCLQQWPDQADRATTSNPAVKVLDLGTGSGAIALALAKERPDLDVHACDISQDSLKVAQDNADRLGLPVTFYCSDWFKSVAEQFHLILANPPYIAPDDPHLATLGAEPTQALIAAEQGLADLAHIIQHSAAHLHDDGWLLLEHGYDQGAAVRNLLAQAGFHHVSTYRDLGDNERVSVGQRPAAPESAHE